MDDMTGFDSSSPDFDVEGLFDRLEGDVEAILEMLRIFQDEFPPRLTELRRKVREGDLHGAAMAAHSLKGLCANIGAERLRGMMAEVEANPGEVPQDLFKQVSAAFLGFTKLSEDLRRRWER